MMTQLAWGNICNNQPEYSKYFSASPIKVSDLMGL
jgi:hypothetical protein